MLPRRLGSTVLCRAILILCLALGLGACGVHLRASSMTPPQQRRVFAMVFRASVRLATRGLVVRHPEVIAPGRTWMTLLCQMAEAGETADDLVVSAHNALARVAMPEATRRILVAFVPTVTALIPVALHAAQSASLPPHALADLAHLLCQSVLQGLDEAGSEEDT